jgi:colanic acid biosynthesis glycosyl transferase WcaI
MLHRLANYVSFNAMASLAGLSSRRTYDVVLANSGSFFTGVTSWLLHLLRRTPFIYNVQDIYPDVPVRAGQLQSGAASRALENVERFMYDRAAHITVIAGEQADVLLRKGVPAEKLSVIPNFVDTNFIRPFPRDNEVSRGLGLNDRFVVAHAGNLGYVYDFEALLAAADLLQKDERVLFLIIGDGVRRADIEEQVTSRKLANVRMLPFQPEADLPQLRAAIDVHLALYTRGAAQSSLPSKIYEIMASARPAIVSAEPGTDLCRLVETSACGICIEPENGQQLADAIRRLSTDADYAARLGQRGREVAVRKYSKEVAVETYADLLMRVAIIDKAKHAPQ